MVTEGARGCKLLAWYLQFGKPCKGSECFQSFSPTLDSPGFNSLKVLGVTFLASPMAETQSHA